MGTFSRWVKYGRAVLDDALKRGNEEMDRREAAQEADAAARPWAHATSESPTLDDVRARMVDADADADAGAEGTPAPKPPPAAPEEGFDLAEQQRMADERLAKIRDELGLGEQEQPPDA